MMRNVILVGAFLGVSASVPILYQASPETFHDLVRRQMEPAAEAEITMVRPLEARATQPVAGRKVRVPADASGHFRADFRFNGRRVEGMLDTGATVIAINASTARRLGLSIGPGDYRHTVRTANGMAPAALAKLATVELGRIRLTDLEALVLKDDALGGTLIGMNFMKNLARFHVEGETMVLEQ
jgi:aspartyl protease family protein